VAVGEAVGDGVGLAVGEAVGDGVGLADGEGVAACGVPGVPDKVTMSKPTVHTLDTKAPEVVIVISLPTTPGVFEVMSRLLSENNPTATDPAELPLTVAVVVMSH